MVAVTTTSPGREPSRNRWRARPSPSVGVRSSSNSSASPSMLQATTAPSTGAPSSRLARTSSSISAPVSALTSSSPVAARPIGVSSSRMTRVSSAGSTSSESTGGAAPRERLGISTKSPVSWPANWIGA